MEDYPTDTLGQKPIPDRYLLIIAGTILIFILGYIIVNIPPAKSTGSRMTKEQREAAAEHMEDIIRMFQSVGSAP